MAQEVMITPMSFGDPASITAYAHERTVQADLFIDQLGALTASLTPPTITPDFPTPGPAPAAEMPEAPTTTNIIWSLPAPPTAFTATLSIDQYLPEPFDSNPPMMMFGPAPATFTDLVPDAPGVDLQFVYPDLTVNLPAPPSLLSISTYKFGGVNIPSLLDEVPTLTSVAPTVIPYTPGQGYASSLLSSLQASLQDRIDNGGTGLAPAVEQAIWDRGREREYRQQATALAELERMERLGYAFPPGVYMDARLKVQTETNYTIAGVSREVMIKAAELEQTNVLQALQTATQLEGVLVNYTNQVEQRAFESAKYATQAGIELYNAQVRAYSAYVDAYKTKVAIYEAQIRGELAKVEAYKAEVDAEQAKAQINTALVSQYKVQADVALSAVEVFKAQIGAIQAKAEIEKLKVSIFGEQVRAYSAKVNAYTAGVEGFRASIQAETAKQEAYKSQVQAYSAEVDAAVKAAQARIDEFKGLIAAKTAEWEGFKSAASAEASRVQSLSAIDQSKSEIYKSVVSGTNAYNELLTKQWQVALDQAQRTSEIGVQAAKANSDLYMTTRSLAMDASKVGAQVSAQLGAAAINAVNWSSSLSNSRSNAFSSAISTSQSTSVNQNKSESISQSVSDNRNESTSTSTSQSDNRNTNQSQSTSTSTSTSESNQTSVIDQKSDVKSDNKNYNYNS